MNSIIEQAPDFNEAHDANTPAAHVYFNKVKEWLLAQDNSISNIDEQARALGQRAVPFRTMLKFIESEKVVSELQQPVLFTLINPVYKETGRMQPRKDHPHGENSLQTKIECIRYFENINSNFKGRIFVVDDECPDGSGKMAQEIVSRYPESPHKVFFFGQSD